MAQTNVGGLAPAALLNRAIAAGAIGQNGEWVIDARAVHADGSKDALGQHVVEGLAGDFLEDQAYQEVAAVAVAALFAGGKVKVTPGDDGVHLRVVIVEMHRFGLAPVVGETIAHDATGVGEQVADGDLLPTGRGIAKIAADTVVER